MYAIWNYPIWNTVRLIIIADTNGRIEQTRFLIKKRLCSTKQSRNGTKRKDRCLQAGSFFVSNKSTRPIVDKPLAIGWKRTGTREKSVNAQYPNDQIELDLHNVWLLVCLESWRISQHRHSYSTPFDNKCIKMHMIAVTPQIMDNALLVRYICCFEARIDLCSNRKNRWISALCIKWFGNN